MIPFLLCVGYQVKHILAGSVLCTFFTEQPLKNYELVMRSTFALRYVCTEAGCSFMIQTLKWPEHELMVFCPLQQYLHWAFCKKEPGHNVGNCTSVLD